MSKSLVIALLVIGLFVAIVNRPHVSATCWLCKWNRLCGGCSCPACERAAHAAALPELNA